MQWLHGGSSLFPDLVLNYSEHHFLQERGHHMPGLKTGTSHLPKITNQSSQFLNHTNPWQAKAHSQNFQCHSPTCSLSVKGLNLKLWLTSSKPHTDAPDLSFLSYRATATPAVFSLPQGWESPTLVSLLSHIHLSSPSPALLHT